MSHLDDLAAALVDNELSHDQRDRALSHIAGCAPCRQEVDAQRRLKALLANQADPVVTVEFSLTLMNIARDAAGPNTPDVVRRRGAGPIAPPAGPGRSRTLRRRAATFSALSVALVAGVVAVGSERDVRRVRPPVSTFVGEHTATTANLPLNDPADAVVMNASYGR